MAIKYILYIRQSSLRNNITMEYRLLAVANKGNGYGVNIGDYIQALASSQFLPTVDGFIDRDDELKDFEGNECKVIMNGWYMHNPQQWPPSSRINPLFVAFHLNVLASEAILSETGIEYLKKHQPIGCRDRATVKVLQAAGIQAYFSGCMTLTLGRKYATPACSGKIYLVDPPFELKLTPKRIIESIITAIKHPIDVVKLGRKQNLNIHAGKNPLLKLVKTPLFYKEYSRIFGKDTILNAVCINQDNDYYKRSLETDYERIAKAESIIRDYSQASLVITSRIHCALPCLGLGTPVIYVERAQDTEASKCRMDGLAELFNIVTLDDGRLTPAFETVLPITPTSCPPNKKQWMVLADQLSERCISFVNA